MAIAISNNKINEIKQNSVMSLPDEPSRLGISAQALKERFVAPITSSANSVIKEINRIVGEFNSEIAAEQTARQQKDNELQDNIDDEAEARANADNALQEVIAAIDVSDYVTTSAMNTALSGKADTAALKSKTDKPAFNLSSTTLTVTI